MNMNIIQILSGSFQIHSVLSDTFNTFRYIPYSYNPCFYNQCIITSAFRSIQYLQGTKKT